MIQLLGFSCNYVTFCNSDFQRLQKSLHANQQLYSYPAAGIIEWAGEPLPLSMASPILRLEAPPPCPILGHTPTPTPTPTNISKEFVQQVVQGPEVGGPVGVAQTPLEGKQTGENLSQLPLQKGGGAFNCDIGGQG